ncbi:MAG: lipoprotein-releasing ABC transporter permease subunit [Alphaproteobacteria bacterium]|nr:lipoprotein-releasing ABC transporter permease subunit [Alphaproteobacteria bacterium]
MFAPVEWLIAARYMRPRRQEGFVSLIAIFSCLGIIFGVMALIIVMSVMNGFRAELIGRILGLNGHVSVLRDTGPFTGFDQIVKNVLAVDGVVSATALVEGQALATANGRASGVLVRGVLSADIKAKAIIAENIQSGSLDAFDGDNAIAIGSRLARSLGIGVGDPIRLLSPEGTVTVFGTMPRVRAYKVVAIFEVGASQYDGAYVYLPRAAAQIYFELGEAISQIEVFVADPDRLVQMRPRLFAAAGPGTRLYDWQQANATFVGALQVERNVMFLILTMIILVAAFNIISSMIMLVKNKSGDIAILRTIGATQGRVMRVFFITGASIGVFGTAVGTTAALLFCAYIEEIRQFLQSLTGWTLFPAEIYFLAHMPAKVDSNEVLSVILMALGLSLAATLYPSWRAAKLDPVEALRYE